MLTTHNDDGIINELDFYENRVRRSASEISRICSFCIAGLQPYISGGDLPEMNPVIIKDFVNLLSCENKFGELERSLVQLAITSIDIHQVVFFSSESDELDKSECA